MQSFPCNVILWKKKYAIFMLENLWLCLVKDRKCLYEQVIEMVLTTHMCDVSCLCCCVIMLFSKVLHFRLAVLTSCWIVSYHFVTVFDAVLSSARAVLTHSLLILIFCCVLLCRIWTIETHVLSAFKKPAILAANYSRIWSSLLSYRDEAQKKISDICWIWRRVQL